MGDKVFYENEWFKVVPVTIKSIEPEEYIDAYGIINKQTGIREAETRRFFTAKVWCDGLEDQIKHPEKYTQVEEPVAVAANDAVRMH